MNNFEISGYRTINYDLRKSAIRTLRKAWKDYAENVESYPSQCKGKGIVMCAGGIKYFTCCWIAIKTLRNTGCRLPIELWYADNELSEETISEIGGFDVTCRNLFENESVDMAGCAFKPLSIIKSSFNEVLFLDSDNICIRNPEWLFETTEYIDYGAIFWPDFWKTPANNPIWKITESKYIESPEQESGQILINKQKCWTALNICLYFNKLSRIYYNLLLGDKDTFRFAWKANNQPYFMVHNEVSSCGYLDHSGKFCGTTMLQYGPDARPLFLHRNLLKWDITRKDELIWQRIKKFNPYATNRSYYLNYSKNGHYYMDIRGDVIETTCSSYFLKYEKRCLKILEELRRSEFYQRFILYTYLIQNRYTK